MHFKLMQVEESLKLDPVEAKGDGSSNIEV